MSTERLDTWKEIARYLGRDVRQAQRYEKNLGMPVHRLGKQSVWAFRSEIDEWFKRSDPKARTVQDTIVDVPETEPASTEHDSNVARAGSADATGPRTRRLEFLRSRRIAAGLGGGAVLATVIAAIVVFRHQRAVPGATNARVPTIVGDYSGNSLDLGAWPTQAHDSRRSNQSDLHGPREAGTPRLIYDDGRPFKPGRPGTGYREQITVASDGRILLGNCGEVFAIDWDGSRVWSQPLREREFPLVPVGFSLLPGYEVIVSVHACTGGLDARKVKLFSFSANGEQRWTQTRAGMYLGSAIGPDFTVFQMDEFNDIHAYQHGMQSWVVDLPGYSQGAIALDSHSALYVGTDGSVYGQPSFWSLDSAGRVRWKLGTRVFGTPVVSLKDDVYVMDAGGTVHAFTRDGDERWQVSLPEMISYESLALGATGTIYAQTDREVVAVSAAGAIRWRVALPDRSASPGPVLDRDENVYVATKSHVHRITNGKLLWDVPLEQPGRIVVGAEGALLVTSAAQKLYAIGTNRSPEHRTTTPFEPR